MEREIAEKYEIRCIFGLTTDFFKLCTKLLNGLNLLVRFRHGHPDHQMEVRSRLSNFLRFNGEYGYPATNRLMIAAETQDEMQALVLSMDIQERSSVTLCFSLWSDLLGNMRRKTVLTDLRESYLKTKESLSYMILPGHMKKFKIYQQKHLIALRLFTFISDRMENNRRQLDDPFLSEGMRTRIHKNLQDDYPKYDNISSQCEEFTTFLNDMNPRPYHEALILASDTRHSLSRLRNEAEKLRRAIFTARVRLHEASDFNKVVCEDQPIFPRNLYPRKREFIDTNSNRMRSLYKLMATHFNVDRADFIPDR